MLLQDDNGEVAQQKDDCGADIRREAGEWHLLKDDSAPRGLK